MSESPELRAIVFKYWRWYVDTFKMDDGSDEAKMLRAYMRSIAEQSYALGAARPEPGATVAEDGRAG